MKYKNLNGHCNVPSRYKTNKQLGTWVSKQRQSYRLMTEGKPSPITTERIEKLEKIGFEWKILNNITHNNQIKEKKHTSHVNSNASSSDLSNASLNSSSRSISISSFSKAHDGDDDDGESSSISSNESFISSTSEQLQLAHSYTKLLYTRKRKLPRFSESSFSSSSSTSSVSFSSPPFTNTIIYTNTDHLTNPPSTSKTPLFPYYNHKHNHDNNNNNNNNNSNSTTNRKGQLPLNPIAIRYVMEMTQKLSRKVAKQVCLRLEKEEGDLVSVRWMDR